MGVILSFVTAVLYVIASHLILCDRFDIALADHSWCEMERVPRNMAYDFMEYGYKDARDYGKPVYSKGKFSNY